MHLVFDIFQGMGIAAAVGIRPFLPTLVVGGLAAGDVEIHFNGTDYGFLQAALFLLLVAVAAIAVALLERRLTAPTQPRPVLLLIAAVSLVLGALLFAASLARGHYAAWPGLIAGMLCAALGIAATQPLLARVRARLDQSAAGALPLYAEGAAVLIAALSVIAPPIGLIAVLLLLWLLLASRRRADQKYAGLRILR